MAIQSVKNHRTEFLPQELLVGQFSELPKEIFDEVIEKLTTQDICTCAKVCKNWSIHLYSGPYADALWELLFKYRYPTPFTFNTDHKETWLEAYKIRTRLHAGLEGEMYTSHGCKGDKNAISMLASDNDKIVSYAYSSKYQLGNLKIWDTNANCLNTISQVTSALCVNGRTLFSRRESPGDFKVLCPVENSNQYCTRPAFQWDEKNTIINLKIEDGRLIVIAKGVIGIFEALSSECKYTSWECRHTLTDTAGVGKSCVVVAQDKLFSIGRGANEIKIWDWKTLEPLNPIVAPRNAKLLPYSALHYANGLLFSAVNLGGDGCVIEVRKDLETYQVLYRLEGHDNAIDRLESVGNKLISNDRSSFKIWDMDSRECLHTISIDSITDWTILDEYIICVTDRGYIEVLSINSGKLLTRLLTSEEANGNVPGRVFINDQVGLVSSSKNFEMYSEALVYIWNLHASDDEILQELVNILKDLYYIEKAIFERFCRLSETTKNAVFEEVYWILDPPTLKCDYWGCGEDAFFNKRDFISKNNRSLNVYGKVCAMRNYLKKKNEFNKT